MLVTLAEILYQQENIFTSIICLAYRKIFLPRLSASLLLIDLSLSDNQQMKSVACDEQLQKTKKKHCKDDIYIYIYN